jgi:hypothetical protein
MKYTLLSILSLCMVALVIVFSCKKTNNNTSTVTNVQSLNQLFAGLRTTPQGLTVTAGRDTMVFGTNGTMLHFYTNSFTNAAGNTITGGSISLQLVEMYKPGDMIANRATTMAGSQLLTSGGQVSVIATMNGQAVYVNRYGIGFKQNAPTTTVMNLFSGDAGNADSVVAWQQLKDSLQHGAFAIGADTSESIAASYGRSWVGYVFDSCSSLEYTNCDALYINDSPKVSISVVLPDNTFTPSNTQVYLVLPDINCAMSSIEPMLGGSNYNAATNSLTIVSEGATTIVPAGMNYKLIVMANKSGQYYFWQTSGIIPHTGITATAILATNTQAGIKTILAGL